MPGQRQGDPRPPRPQAQALALMWSSRRTAALPAPPSRGHTHARTHTAEWRSSGCEVGLGEAGGEGVCLRRKLMLTGSPPLGRAGQGLGPFPGAGAQAGHAEGRAQPWSLRDPARWRPGPQAPWSCPQPVTWKVLF